MCGLPFSRFILKIFLLLGDVPVGEDLPLYQDGHRQVALQLPQGPGDGLLPGGALPAEAGASASLAPVCSAPWAASPAGEACGRGAPPPRDWASAMICPIASGEERMELSFSSKSSTAV